jgi:hypothetical protein
MSVRSIGNANLTLADVPESNATWKEIASFAASFVHGDPRRSSTTAKGLATRVHFAFTTNRPLPKNLNTLRTALLFEQQRLQRLKRSPTRAESKYLQSILQQIRDSLGAKNGTLADRGSETEQDAKPDRRALKSGSLSMRGSQRWAFAQYQTKNGEAYWRIVQSPQNTQCTPPIWSSEIDWLLNSLERIARDLNPDKFARGPLVYPLDFVVNNIDAVVLLLDRREEAPRLRFERWKGTWLNAEREATYVRRYFGPAGRGSFGHLMLESDWALGLRALVTDFRTHIDGQRRLNWSEATKNNAKLSSDVPQIDRVIVHVLRNGNVTALPWNSCFSAFTDPAVLDRPLPEVVLEACKAGTNVDQISAALDRILDAKQVNRLLSWSTRYASTTLSAGYFLRVDADEQRKPLFAATRDLQAFAADPLFLDLGGIEHQLSPGDANAPSPATPQFQTGIPLKALKERAAIRGVADSPYGSVPLPNPTRVSATRRIASIPAAMNRYRWWMLQFLDLASATLINLHPTNTPEAFAAFQRVGLLLADSDQAFASNSDNSRVVGIQAETKERLLTLLKGGTMRGTVKRKADLP